VQSSRFSFSVTPKSEDGALLVLRLLITLGLLSSLSMLLLVSLVALVMSAAAAAAAASLCCFLMRNARGMMVG
jgi:hypothetical protein